VGLAQADDLTLVVDVDLIAFGLDGSPGIVRISPQIG